MANARKNLMWRVLPLVGLAVAIAALALANGAVQSPALSVALPIVGIVVLLAVVFTCVYHADVIAHRTGEPYGTLVLTVAVTVIVALIPSIMDSPPVSVPSTVGVPLVRPEDLGSMR